MTTRTRIVLRSGDKAALEDVVDEIRAVARRKGAEIAGPHTDAPTDYAVPQYKRLDGDAGETFGHWTYTVYERRFVVSGHDQLVRTILDREFPSAVQVDVEIEQAGDPMS